MQIHSFKETALETSKQSVCHFQHGALLIRNNKIISSGFNDEKTSC